MASTDKTPPRGIRTSSGQYVAWLEARVRELTEALRRIAGTGDFGDPLYGAELRRIARAVLNSEEPK